MLHLHQRLRKMLFKQLAICANSLVVLRPISSAPPGKESGCPFSQKSQVHSNQTASHTFRSVLKQNNKFTNAESVQAAQPFEKIPTPAELSNADSNLAEYAHLYCDELHKNLGSIFQTNGYVKSIFLSDAELVKKVCKHVLSCCCYPCVIFN